MPSALILNDFDLAGTIFEPGEAVAVATGPRLRGGAAALYLSSAHICTEGVRAGRVRRPFVHDKPLDAPSLSYAAGGRWVHLKVPAPAPVGGGVRGEVGDFSRGSRSRMLRKVNSIDQSRVAVEAVGLVTLTYPAVYVTPRQSKEHLRVLLQRFQRVFGNVPLFWKLEPQERGAPHYHLLVFAESNRQLLTMSPWFAEAWHQIAGEGDANHLRWHLGQLGNRPCLEPIKTWNGVTSYATKYLGKLVSSRGLESWQHPGRWWGTRFYERLPRTIERRELQHVQAVAAKRLMRRWFDHQPSGRFRIVRDGRIRRHWLKPASAAYLARSGVDVRPIYRKWSRSRGGMNIFAGERVALDVLRYLESIARECNETTERLQTSVLAQPSGVSGVRVFLGVTS